MIAKGSNHPARDFVLEPAVLCRYGPSHCLLYGVTLQWPKDGLSPGVSIIRIYPEKEAIGQPPEAMIGTTPATEKSRWALHSLVESGLEPRGIDNRPDVNNPAQQDEPEHSSQNKLNCGNHEPSLQQLTQTRHKQAAKGSQNVSCGSLSRHFSPFLVQATRPSQSDPAATNSYECCLFLFAQVESNTNPSLPASTPTISFSIE